MEAAIKERERLENIRRAEDEEALRREIEDEEEATDAAGKNQRQRLERAAKVKFEDTEHAHQRKLQAMSDAANAKKKQAITPRAPRSLSRKRKQRVARPAKRSQVDIENLDLSDADENPSDEDEVFGDSAPLTLGRLVTLMSETMASAMEKVERRGRRSIPINSVDTQNVYGITPASSAGRLALRAMSNPEMADRLGVAPAPNLYIEGDPTSLDVQKIQKHMKSGSPRGQRRC